MRNEGGGPDRLGFRANRLPISQHGTGLVTPLCGSARDRTGAVLLLQGSPRFCAGRRYVRRSIQALDMLARVYVLESGRTPSIAVALDITRQDFIFSV